MLFVYIGEQNILVKFVNILYSMCKRNLKDKFNFYCLTDETNQCISLII